MSDKKVAIVLGGLKMHIILIERLKDRGYYTILVDYLNAPPAAKYADEHIKISTFDIPSIKELAQNRQTELIINCCIEHINVGIAKIAEELHLPMLYSYETALNVSDKYRMKKIMCDHSIPTTAFVCVTSTDDLTGLDLGFPVFVKPADGSGSTGVNKAVNNTELYQFTNLALKCSRSKAAIIEEEAIGKECNVYCVIQNGKAKVILISEKYSEIRGNEQITKAIGSLTPALISEKAKLTISKTAQDIADAFKLGTMPMFMQLMVNGDEINIIEFACRMAGGYSFQNIKNKLGFDYFNFTIDAFLGKETEIKLQDSGEYSSIHSLYASPCIFSHIEGLEELKKQNVISDFMVARDSGTQVTNESANREKVGFFIVKGNHIDELLEKIQYTFEHIEAYDIEGHVVLRKDLYLTRNLLDDTAEEIIK